MSEHGDTMNDDKNRRGKVVAVCAIWVNVLCCLVWPNVLYKFVETKARHAWLWDVGWVWG